MYKLYFLDGVVVGVVSGWGWVWFQNVLFNVAYVLVIDAYEEAD